MGQERTLESYGRRKDSADQSFQSCQNSLISDDFPEEEEEGSQNATYRNRIIITKSRFADVSQLADEETLAMQIQALLEWILGIEWILNDAEVVDNPILLNHYTAYSDNLFSRNLDGAREVKRSSIRKETSSRPPRYGMDCSLPNKCPISLSLFLKTIGAKNNHPEDDIIWLSFSNLELLVILIVRSLLVNDRMGFLEKLFEITLRTQKAALDRHIATSRLYKTLAFSRGVNLDELLPDLKQCIINHCTLPLVCPELYEGITPLTTAEMTDSIWSTATSPSSKPNVCQMVTQAIEDNELVDHETILIGVCDRIFTDIKGRRLQQLQPNGVRALTIIATIPTVAQLLVRRPYWLLDEASNNKIPNKIPLGWRYMGNTLLGRLCQATPMDSMRQGDEMKDFVPTVDAFFKPLIPKGTAAAHNPIPVQDRLRNSMKGVINEIVQFVKAMLKHGGEVRSRTLQWFALVLEANSKFASLDFRHHHRFFARLPPIFFMPLHVSMGLCTIGFGFNVIWTLLELCRPISLSKLTELDPLWPHWCRIQPDGGLLGVSIKSEADFVDEESLKVITADLCRVRPLGEGQVKFPTQIFWLTLKGIRVFLFPAVADYEWKHQVLVNNGREVTQRDAPKEDLLAECLAWTSLLACDRVMDAFSHFSELACGVFLHAAFGFTKTGDIRECDQTDLMTHPVLQLVKVPKLLKSPEESVSPQFASMPLRFYSDFFETVSKFILNTSSPLLTSQQKLNPDIENWMIDSNCELFAASLLLILSDRSVFIRNSGFKLEAAAYNMTAISVTNKFRTRMHQTSAYSTALASALVTAFSQAQKLSYYMRIELRLILTRELKDQLARPEFRNQMAEVSTSQQEDFEKFLHFLASNTNWVIEEALTQMSEIKKREAKYGPTGIPDNHDTGTADGTRVGGTSMPPNTNQANPSDGDRIAEEIEGGRNVSEMPFDDLVSQCKGLMEAGSISLVVFNSFDSRVYNFILQSDVLLPQMLLCLNGCLDSLVGPRCMTLKVANFEKYNFRPREFLNRLCSIYVALIGNRTITTTTVVVKEIVNESRFFKIKLFTKALRIIKREGLADAKTTRRFDELVAALSEAVASAAGQETDETLMVDIPDEFLDPIMAEIMLDPVRLPSSGVVCDRKVIERHLIAEEFDPFNRAPLIKADLVPEDNLRRAIQDFVANRRTKTS